MKIRILNYLFFAFCFTLPLSQLLNSRILLVMVALSFFLTNRKFSISGFFRQSWDLILYFLILLIGLSYSSDLALGLRQIETNLSLIGLPIIVYNLAIFSKEKVEQTFYFFAAGVVAASLICLGNAVITYHQADNLQAFFYSALTQPIDSHPTYFAYYLIFTITYGLYLLYYELPRHYVVVAISALIFLFLMLLLTGGQTAFISMLLTFSFFISKYILEKKSKRESVAVVLVIAMLTCMISLMIIFQNDDHFLSLSNQNDYWERMVLWESAIQANSNPLIGVGTGDYTIVLNEYYRAHDLTRFANANFNSHNQFIQLYFSNGIIGLIGLLILLARPLYLSVRFQNLLGVLIFFPFLVYGITEVFLGRYQGVVFLGLLHQLFISYYMDAKPAYSLKVGKL